jgi:selenoprotein W-related protein
LSRAVSLTEEILNQYSMQIGEFTLIPDTGGVFELTLDGELIFSKKALGRFPEVGEVLELLKNRIS